MTALSNQLLENVAETYAEAVAAGRAPAVAVADHFGLPLRTAAYWIRKAKKAGILTISYERTNPRLVSAAADLGVSPSRLIEVVNLYFPSGLRAKPTRLNAAPKEEK